jgi:hypothetical protein
VWTPIGLLHALALEIDERVATRTGERVCRACDGRGREIVAWYPLGTAEGMPRWIDERYLVGLWSAEVDDWVDSWTSPGPGSEPPDFMPDAIAEYDSHLGLALVHVPCAGHGPARPETVELHRVVEACASMSRPHFEWPEGWLVNLDGMLVGAPDWIARWWLAFREWTHAGKEPDARALAADLAALIPELEARERAKRKAATYLLAADRLGRGGLRI